MKQLILKELREQFKVALIGLVLLTGMLGLAFAGYGNELQRAMQHHSNSDSFQPLLRNELLVQIAFFCGLFGTLLGWLQIRAEHHPDLWAFLMHRPIHRTRILQSKVAAGLLLYVAGAGLPLLGFVLVVATPGNVAAPFSWPMALPVTSIFLVGMVHYFAGLLTGLRQARWFASRAVGVGLAVVATLVLFGVPEFWHALLIVAGTGTALAVAVWGSFQTGGFYRDQPVAGKVALTLASTASCLVLIGMSLTFMANLLASRGDYSYTHHQIARNGKVLRITQQGTGEADITDHTGKPVLDEKTGQKLRSQDLGAHYARGLIATADADTRSKPGGQHWRSYTRLSRFFSPWGIENKTLWYLTAEGRLVGYHATTRRFVGEIVPPGMAHPGAADDSVFLLPQTYSHSAFQNGHLGVLASARAAYRVDLEKRELKPLLTMTNGNAILGCSVGALAWTSQRNDAALVLSRTGIHLLDLDGGIKLELPYLPAAPKYPQVSVFSQEATNTYVVKFDPSHLLNKVAGGKLLTHVKWVDADGSTRNAMDLPELSGVARQVGTGEWLLIPLTPPGVPFWTWDEPYRVLMVLRIIPALICVGAGWWLGQRNQFPAKSQLAWAIHHLLFGLPGFLAFLAVQEWPVKEPCPNCQQPRAVDRSLCEHCGAACAPPAPSGTEIFAPLTGN